LSEQPRDTAAEATHPGQEGTVNFHWDALMTVWEPRSHFSDDEIWATPDCIRLGNCRIPILNGEALLVFLCVHFAFHHEFDGLLLLCNLYLLLRCDAERINWNRLIAIASQCRCRTAFYYALFFAKAVMAAPVRSDILDRLRPPALTQALMPTGRPLFRDSIVPKMLERHVKFLLINSLEGRWRAFRVRFTVM